MTKGMCAFLSYDLDAYYVLNISLWYGGRKIIKFYLVLLFAKEVTDRKMASKVAKSKGQTVRHLDKL